MILETLSYAFHSISCPKYIRELRLLHEIIAIEARYKRCKQAWRPHLENCKELIINEALKLRNRDYIIVLGAGSLHDVPLKELSKLFKEVHLVDIFFLQSTIGEMRAYPNVEFHQIDITGVLKAAYEARSIDNESHLAAKLDFLSQEIPKHFLSDENIDMVISLNLLSQLPIAIKDFYERKEIRNPRLENFYQSLIINHLRYLRSFTNKGSKILLITDTERSIENEPESSLLKLDPSIFNGFEKINEWQWLIAPQGELIRKYKLELTVKSYSN